MAKKPGKAGKTPASDSPARPKESYAKPEPPKAPESGAERIAGKAKLENDPYAQFANLGIPKEAQKKLKELKDKLDRFKEESLKKFDKYIAGIALVPPRQPAQGMPLTLQPPAQPQPAVQPLPSAQLQPGQAPQPAQAPGKEQVGILVLVDDSDSKRMAKEELKARLSSIMQGIANGIDTSFSVQTLILSDVWQNCYDGKYDLLQLISSSAPVYDTGMLAAIRIAEVHKSMVLRKFERYIVSYVLAGSLIQGRASEKSDIDVFIVIDDTDVKRMTRVELKDKLRAIIIGMGLDAGDITAVRNKLNIQVYILTDFWDSIREANPIIFTFLRDGVPFYDRGIFMPWKQLLQMGKIRPSGEAIELYMSTGDQMLKRAKYKLKEIGMEDTFWAILTPSQAALMLYGIPPPTPKETPEVMREIFVKKESLLEEEYVKILERNIQARKDLEHGDRKELSGREVDELLSDSEKYLKRIDRLFSEIQRMKEEQGMLEVYDNIVTMIRDILRLEGVEKVEDMEIVQTFEDEMISSGKIPAKFLRILNSIIKAKKDYDGKKLTKAEVERVKKESENFVRFLVEYMQRKRGKELERARIRVKHGDRFGEVLLLGDEAFIIHDTEHEEKEVSRAKLTEGGSLADIRASSMEELEKALVKAEIPPKLFLKERIFEDLKRVFGKDVEVMVGP